MNDIEKFLSEHDGIQHNVVITSTERVETEYRVVLNGPGVSLGEYIEQEVIETTKDELWCKGCFVGLDITGRVG